MRNIKLTIQYKGTNYCGWQIQNRVKKTSSRNEKTIQGEIERVLKKVLKEKVKLIGACRTDSGVHALSQVANFKTKSNLHIDNIHRALNSLLPKDIAIKSIKEEKEDFHSRFDAKGKIYQYKILNLSTKDVFENDYAWRIIFDLNRKKIEQAARHIIGRHNFSSFSSAGSKRKNVICDIKRIDIRKKRDIYIVEVEGDRFLYRMVRNIVGTLVEIGRGRFTPRDIKRVLSKRDRRFAGPCAPASGLILQRVMYN